MKSVGEAMSHRADLQGVACRRRCARLRPGGEASGSDADGKIPRGRGSGPRLPCQEQAQHPELHERIFYLKHALRCAGMEYREKSSRLTGIDPWFLDQIKARSPGGRGGAWRRFGRDLRKAKKLGLLRPAVIARFTGVGVRRWSVAREKRKGSRPPPTAWWIPARRSSKRLHPLLLLDLRRRKRSPAQREERSVMILGGGPNRIGQGIEFDYCCVHASFALKELGFETIMVNSNPETVSTDYDTSDKLYFEPLTLEDVLNICRAEEKPWGVIVQFGGQTPLNLAADLEATGVPIIGTSRPETSSSPRTASFSPRAPRETRPQTGAQRALRSRRMKPSRSRPRSATRCSCVLPSSSGDAP